MSSTLSILSTVSFVEICIGQIGNILTFLVFSRKKFRNNSVNVYCRALAIIDSFYIIIQLVSRFGQFAGYDLRIQTTVCKLTFYIFLTVPPISGWTLVALSIDKAISILKPNKIIVIRKLWFQLTVISSIIVINLAIYVMIPIYLTPTQYKITLTIMGPNGTTNVTQVINNCNVDSLSFVNVINFLFLIESSFVPFLFMFGTTCVITRAIYMSRARVQAAVQKESREKKSRRVRDRKFAITSMVLNILYVIFQSPIIFTYLVSVSDLMTYYVFYVSAAISLNMNFCIPFWIHLVSNSIFRHEFAVMIGLRKQSNQLSVKSNTQSISKKD